MWAIQHDDDIEVNLVTKNLKEDVTQEKLLEKFNEIVPISKISIVEFGSSNPQYSSVKKLAYIHLDSGENGRKLIDKAVKSP